MLNFDTGIDYTTVILYVSFGWTAASSLFSIAFAIYNVCMWRTNMIKVMPLYARMLVADSEPMVAPGKSMLFFDVDLRSMGPEAFCFVLAEIKD